MTCQKPKIKLESPVMIVELREPFKSLTAEFRERQPSAREERLRERSRARRTEETESESKDLFASDLIEQHQLRSFDSADTFIRLANRSEINSS